jgi:hypothetical protein
VVFILLNDFIITSGSVEPFTAGGQLRNTDEHSCLVKICPLLAEANLHRWTSVDIVSVPIGNSITRWTSLLAAVNAAQIRSPGGIPRVSTASHDKPNETNSSSYSQKTEQRIVHSFDGVLNAQPAQKVKRGSPQFAPFFVIPSEVEESLIISEIGNIERCLHFGRHDTGLFAPLIHPIVHGLVPELAVLRFKHPMTFVREI